MRGASLISRNVFLGLLTSVFFAACTASVDQDASSQGQAQVKSIRVGDTDLHYVDRGQGIPVVFVHGAVGDYRTWDGQIEAFSKDYRAISYSQRYHYPNEYPQDAVVFPRADHVEDLKGFIDALDISPVHLVGHSGGGAISLEFARDYPEYLISLTLAEPAVPDLLATTPEGVAARQFIVETVFGPSTAAFQAGDDEEGVRRFIDGVMGGENGFDNLPSNFREGMLQNAHTMRSSRLDTTPRTRTRPSFSCEDGSHIRIPTFLIHGELSLRQFVLTNELLEQCLPNVERATLQSASHGLEMENPEGFNDIVLEFIGRHADVWEPFAGALADTQRRNLTSEITGQTYQISVALPENYATSNETYPVLYAVDANGEFGTVVEAAQSLQRDWKMNAVPELIIVGIGYPVGRFTNTFKLRDVDLTPTEDPGLLPEGSGGGPKFLNFIRRELIPLVELEFRADPTDRALFGHSLGGLFGLYALLAGEDTFQRIIAASPSIGWDDRVIFQMESTYAKSHDSLPVILFLSSGLLEDDEEWGESASYVRELVTILDSRNHSGLQIKTAYFENETHISVIPAAISRGLRSIYEELPGAVTQ